MSSAHVPGCCALDHHHCQLNGTSHQDNAAAAEVVKQRRAKHCQDEASGVPWLQYSKRGRPRMLLHNAMQAKPPNFDYFSAATLDALIISSPMACKKSALRLGLNMFPGLQLAGMQEAIRSVA